MRLQRTKNLFFFNPTYRSAVITQISQIIIDDSWLNQKKNQKNLRNLRNRPNGACGKEKKHTASRWLRRLRRWEGIELMNQKKSEIELSEVASCSFEHESHEFYEFAIRPGLDCSKPWTATDWTNHPDGFRVIRNAVGVLCNTLLAAW